MIHSNFLQYLPKDNLLNRMHNLPRRNIIRTTYSDTLSFNIYLTDLKSSLNHNFKISTIMLEILTSYNVSKSQV